MVSFLAALSERFPADPMVDTLARGAENIRAFERKRRAEEGAGGEGTAASFWDRVFTSQRSPQEERLAELIQSTNAILNELLTQLQPSEDDRVFWGVLGGIRLLSKLQRKTGVNLKKPFLRRCSDLTLGPGEASARKVHVCLGARISHASLEGLFGLLASGRESVVLQHLSVIPQSASRVGVFVGLELAERDVQTLIMLAALEGLDGAAVSVHLDRLPVDSRAPSGEVLVALGEGGMSLGFFSALFALLGRLGVQIMGSRLLSLRPLRALELHVSLGAGPSRAELEEQLYALSSETKVDVSLQRNDLYRRAKRLAVFDMDSTLIQQEVIDELARCANVFEEVRLVTEEAMRGNLDFAQSLTKRVSKLEGMPVSKIEEVKQILRLTEGAKDLCRFLGRMGCKTVVVSGGFTPFVAVIQQILGLNHAYANKLEFDRDGLKLTGRVEGEIVDARKKETVLRELSAQENLHPSQVLAVGDGANDLLMLAAAGMGVAFNAKPKVQKEARHRINQRSLLNVLYLMGYSDEEIQLCLRD